MRHLTLKQKMHLKGHAARSQIAKLHWKDWRRLANGGLSRKGAVLLRRVSGSDAKRVILFRDGKRVRAQARTATALPKIFCLDKNADETLEFLAYMRGRILGQAVEYQKHEEVERQRRHRFGRQSRRRRPPRHFLRSYFDFKTLRVISPTAALILAALYDRRKAITGFRPFTVDEHLWDPNVVTLLRSVGFHELLEMRPEKDGSIGDQSIRVLKFVSGEKVAGEELGNLQDRLAGLLPEDDRERLLYAEPYAGMIEAALNSHMWAYPDGHEWEFPSVPRWWMTGALDVRNKTVTVAVYDQGVSIPVSLPRWEQWGKVQRMANRLMAKSGIVVPLNDPQNDASAIHLAMAVARSKTGLPQHGKGLNTMVEVVERATSGRIRIISRNGEYIWEKGKKPQARTYSHSIGGTLIEWRLQL